MLKPSPRPPISTRAPFTRPSALHGSSASSSSDVIAVVLINCRPFSFRKYSPSCSCSEKLEPSGVRVWPSVMNGFKVARA